MTSERLRGISDDAPRASTADRQPAPMRRRSLTKAYRLLAMSAAGLSGVLLAGCGSDDSDTESNSTPERPNTITAVGADRLASEPDQVHDHRRPGVHARADGGRHRARLRHRRRRGLWHG